MGFTHVGLCFGRLCNADCNTLGVYIGPPHLRKPPFGCGYSPKPLVSIPEGPQTLT